MSILAILATLAIWPMYPICGHFGDTSKRVLNALHTVKGA